MRKLSPNRKATRKSPPLIIWWIVFLLTTITLCFAYKQFCESYPDRISKRAEALFKKNSALIEEFCSTAESSKTRKVVVIGTSLLRRGIYTGDSMPPYMNSIGKTDISILRISQSGAKYSDFSKILDLILTKDIELILVQFDLITVREKNDKTKFNEFTEFVRRTLHPRPTIDTSEREDRIVTKTLQVNFTEKRKQHYSSFYDNQTLSRQIFLTDLSRARKAGIDIALLYIPRSSPAEKFIKQKSDTSAGSLIKDFKDSYDIKTLRPRQVFTLEHFYDLGHMNEAGRQRYVQWFGHAVYNYIQEKGL